MIESEKLLERKLGIEVKKIGGVSIKLTNLIGIPDRLCVFEGGYVCFVELKTTGQKTRKVQNLMIMKLRSLGFDVRVIDSTIKINKLIEDYGKRI